MQQQIHTTAQKGAKHPKRFRGKPWTSVSTAYDELIEEDRVKLAEANKTFMAMFEFVPEDEFHAELAEHVAALEAGADESPVQQRAREQAADREPAESVTRGGLGVPPEVADPFRR